MQGIINGIAAARDEGNIIIWIISWFIMSGGKAVERPMKITIIIKISSILMAFPPLKVIIQITYYVVTYLQPHTKSYIITVGHISRASHLLGSY